MSAETIFLNGTVWTGTSQRPTTDALTVRDGQIAALGDDARSSRTSNAEIIDLQGGFLMPAFGDGHAHPIFAGLEFQGPRIAGLQSVGQISAAVRDHARQHPEEPWIVGASYDPTLAPRGAFDAGWLDQAVADRPVVLRASDYHTVWCNSEALRRAGITADTPDPRLGRILRRDDGSPLGTLLEWHACDLVLDLVPRKSPNDLVKAVRDASKIYARSGVTWVQDAWIDHGTGMTEAYLDVAAEGDPLIRFSLALRADPDSWRDQRAVFHQERLMVDAAGVGDFVAARTVKFFADGVIESGTAALLAPYHDAPHSCGMQVWHPAELAKAVTAFDRDGFQVHIHAIGDAGVRAAIDAIERACHQNPLWDRRPVIAHTQLVSPADLSRFAQFGIIANFEPLWAQLDSCQNELTLPRLGAQRGSTQYPIRALLDRGTPVSFGSDWPVTSPHPLEGIQIAVTRQTLEGEPPRGWIPEQRLGLEQAIAAYTAGSAYQAFADTTRGTLAPGKSADLVQLSENPFHVARSTLSKLQVVRTWLAGRMTYDQTDTEPA